MMRTNLFSRSRSKCNIMELYRKSLQLCIKTAGTDIICKIFLSTVEMDVFRFPFVFGFLRSGGVSYRDDGERDYILRHAEIFLYRIDTFGVGIYTCPYGSESEGMGGKQEIFSCGRYILNPEASVYTLTVNRFAEVSADDDGERCLREHTCVGERGGERVEYGTVIDGHECPWLFVDSCGG